MHSAGGVHGGSVWRVVRVDVKPSPLFLRGQCSRKEVYTVQCTLSPVMTATNRVGLVLSYRPAGLSSLTTQFQTRFLESIPNPV